MIPSKELLYHIRLALADKMGQWILPTEIKPILANINLTENCNSRCMTCDYWKKKHIDGISMERAVRLLDELKDIGVTNIRFTGGEPLLREDLFEIVSSCSKGDFRKIVLATNGLLIDKFHKEINNSVLTNITVSIDAVGERNDKIRGVAGYYKKVLENLSKIKKQRIKIVSTLSNMLVQDVEQLIQLCRNSGYGYDVNLPDNKMYFFQSGKVKASLESLRPSEAEMNELVDILEKENILSGVLLQNVKSYMRTGRFQFSHCMQGFLEVNLDSQGNVRTGCNVFKPIGNINTQPLAELISSREYNDSVQRMFRFDCPGCTCGYGISAMYSNIFSTSAAYLVKRFK